MMVALRFYGYATGVLSSRKLEQASFDSVAFRYVAANQHPDHDTIATFRKRFLEELSAVFVQILSVPQQMGVLKLGKVSLDGTKIHANASKHSALSWEHACKIDARLRAEVEQLMRVADEADQAEIPDGRSVPAEPQRREERLAAIAQAKAAIEARGGAGHPLVARVLDTHSRRAPHYVADQPGWRSPPRPVAVDGSTPARPLEPVTLHGH